MPQHPSDSELAWLAGFLHGKNYLRISHDTIPVLDIEAPDEDSAKRISKILNGESERQQKLFDDYHPGLGTIDVYQIIISGPRAARFIEELHFFSCESEKRKIISFRGKIRRAKKLAEGEI